MIKASPANQILPARPVRRVLPKYQTVIFINGCSWHGHKNLSSRQTGCKYFVVPKTRTEWWLNKINNNIANDKKAAKALKKEGGKIITVWECDLKKGKTLLKLVTRLKDN